MIQLNHDELDQLWSNPAHWNRDGSYKCAADPRLVVPRRGGGGLTLNMEHRRAWIVMVGVVVFALRSSAAPSQLRANPYPATLRANAS